jgi:hypothetical protein
MPPDVGNVRYTADSDKEGVEAGVVQKEDEVLVVCEADTVTHPRTVVVHL